MKGEVVDAVVTAEGPETDADFFDFELTCPFGAHELLRELLDDAVAGDGDGVW